MDSRDAHIEDTREPADTVEYSEVVKAFLDDHEADIESVLEDLLVMNYIARGYGIERDFADAADRVVDLIRHVYPTYKLGGALALVRKLKEKGKV